MSDPVHPLTLWLARASMAFYAVAILISASSGRGKAEFSFRRWRIIWSAACVLLIVHVLSAFQFEHGWSHAAALKHTAEQTARVTNIDWSGGLYFNYVFLLLWILDIVVLWLTPQKRWLVLRRTTDVACIFMVFNATVVFGPRWWIFPAVAVVLLAVQLRRAAETSSNGNAQSDENQPHDDPGSG